MQWTYDELDSFVKRSDQAGGPGSPSCDALWADFTYKPAYQVDQTLDPFGEAYVAEQMALYQELAGRPYAAQSSELLDFDIERHIAAVNPYDHPHPAVLAMHLQRLSRALRLAGPRRGERLVDMGCGWGLSSELCAYLGLEVTAVDINPSFVRLVSERARAGRLAITAARGQFEDFVPTGPVDIILFYECLHHAVRPWLALGHLASFLRAGGRVVMAGEPILHAWWTNWGLRLDALSIYCIRKFGWFESGWTMPFITACLERSNLIANSYPDTDPLIGDVIVGEKRQVLEMLGATADCLSALDGAAVKDGWLCLTGIGGFTLTFPEGASAVTLSLSNFRGKPIWTRLSSGGVTLFSPVLQSGGAEVRVPRRDATMRIEFGVDGWSPARELGNGDDRTVGLHIGRIAFT